MQVDLTQLIGFLQNALALGVIIYWIIVCLRDWRGSPDQKAFIEARGQIHEEITLWMKILGKVDENIR